MFQIEDPLNNRIVLTKDCWNNHILKEHLMMKHFYHRLKQTIKLPDYIFRSRIKKDASLYFKEFPHTRFGRLYIMAAVEYKKTKPIGYITTAFPVYNLKKGGELIWKR